MPRLESIEIKDLFGRKGFDQKIDFNYDPGITIIVGANGFGKTTILQMINGLLNTDLTLFFSVPFTKVKFIFSEDKNSIEFIQEKNDSGKVSYYICFGNEKGKKIKIDSINLSDNMELAEFLDDYQYRKGVFVYPSARRSGRLTNKSSEKLYSCLYDFLEEAPIQYLQRTRAMFGIENIEDIKRVLKKINEISSVFPVHFISTDRLISRDIDREDNPRRGEISPKLMVNENNKELSRELEDTLLMAMQKSQDLDNSFPYRIIKKIKQNQKSEDLDVLRAHLDDINQRRQQLIAYGLFDNFSDIDPESINDISSESQNYASMVLDEYIKDSEEKMKILEEEAEKIRLLQSIIDKRFLFKKMRVNRKNGMQFLPANQDKNIIEEKVIPLSSLSSGEQHELILFYKLLFQVSKDSLVLIDEPELSLHVSWQKYFVDDVIEIANKNHFDVIIATHSPQIFQDHLYLTTRLSEIE